MNFSDCKTCCLLDPAVRGHYFSQSWKDILKSAQDCHICDILKQAVYHIAEGAEIGTHVHFYLLKDGLPILAPELHRFGRKIEYIQLHTGTGCSNSWQCFPPAPELGEGEFPLHLERQTMGEWLDTCTGSHTRCRYELPALPKRIIEIGSDGSEPYLVEDVGKKARYVTLSHRWGDEQSGTIPAEAMTKTATIEDRKRVIPMDSLPQTFRDSITVARALNINYLWIDSLCIVQDSREDWDEESAKMNLVYGNSTVTIAADGAANCHGGLFDPIKVGREESYKLSLPRGCAQWNAVYCRRNNMIPKRHSWDPKTGVSRTWNESESYPTDRRVHPTTHKNHLSDRAWALQETLLSPRVLHFATGELIWECDTGHACECQSEFYTTSDATSHNRGFYLPLDDKQSYKWKKLVEQYTERALTFEVDRLHALSGIVQAFFPNAAGRYVGGLCNVDGVEFVYDLLWHSKRSGGRKSTHERIVPYQAPTWSWASVTGSIAYDPFNFMSLGKVSPHLSVHKVHFIPSSKNPFGSIQGGAYLRVTGLMRRYKVTHGQIHAESDQRCLYPIQLSCRLDVDGPEVEMAESEGIILLEMADFCGGVCSLMLKPITERENAYRRVGLADYSGILEHWHTLQHIEAWTKAGVERTVSIF